MSKTFLKTQDFMLKTKTTSLVLEQFRHQDPKSQDYNCGSWISHLSLQRLHIRPVLCQVYGYLCIKLLEIDVPVVWYINVNN